MAMTFIIRKRCVSPVGTVVNSSVSSSTRISRIGRAYYVDSRVGR